MAEVADSDHDVLLTFLLSGWAELELGIPRSKYLGGVWTQMSQL